MHVHTYAAAEFASAYVRIYVCDAFVCMRAYCVNYTIAHMKQRHRRGVRSNIASVRCITFAQHTHFGTGGRVSCRRITEPVAPVAPVVVSRKSSVCLAHSSPENRHSTAYDPLHPRRPYHQKIYSDQLLSATSSGSGSCAEARRPFCIY